MKATTLLLATILGLSLQAESKTTKWPKMRDQEETISFKDSGPSACAILIYDDKGVPAYLLDCYLNASEFSGRQDYSGDFECCLQPLYEKYNYRNLLTYTKSPTRNWESRGRFLLTEFANPMNEARGWGKNRVFRLRGMELLLQIKSYTLSLDPALPPWAEKGRPRINSLTFKYSIHSVPTVTDSIHEWKINPEPLQ